LISGNDEFGILIGATSGEVIQDNKLGTDVVGTVAVPNKLDGVYIIGAYDDTVAGNLISGNGRFGVFLLGLASTNGLITSYNNVVQNNIIGLGQGAGGLANSDDGIALFAGATNNTIGGTTSGTGNLISGNGRFGIYLNGTGTTGNLIQGNRIGTSVDATIGQGNALDGIAVFAGPANNTFGGTTAGARNVISGNGRDGVFLANAGSGNGVEGNFIGTSGDGSKAVGNSGNGIALESVTNTTVGGTAAGAGNVISGNTEGVVLIGAGATGNLLQGNLLGTDESGATSVANTVFGVDIQGGASGNTIGGTVSGAGNTIAFSSRSGVVVGNAPSDAATTGNAILGNSIFLNDLLGIDLGNDGTTANGPAGSGRSGPNDLQNHPVFAPATATVASGSASATITFSSLANSTFRLEFFLNEVTDTPAQGRTFLGAITVTTDAAGNLATAASASPSVSVGTVTGGTVQVTLPLPSGTTTGSLTATATAVTVASGKGGVPGDTSEFSAPATLTGP
jgi:titin